jgi:hypothetical protein
MDLWDMFWKSFRRRKEAYGRGFFDLPIISALWYKNHNAENFLRYLSF